MLDLTAIEANLKANNDVLSSVSELLTALLDEVEAGKSDPAAIQAVVDHLRANSDNLVAAAVKVNTPLAKKHHVKSPERHNEAKHRGKR